MYQVVGLFLLF